MSLLAQLNPLRFYSDVRSRQFENTQNKNRMLTYPMFLDGATTKCKVPKWSLILNSTSTGGITNVVTSVYDCSDTKLFDIYNFGAISNGNYIQVLFNGSDVTHNIVGYHYLKVVITSIDNGAETFYSDLFEWTDDLDDKLKIVTESSKVKIGENPVYYYEMINTSHEFYIGVVPLTSADYLKEEAVEPNAVTNTIFGSSALLRSFLLKANEPIFMFLRTLRILSSNGIVNITWKYITYPAIDILVNIENDLGNADLINVKIEFKVSSEVVSVCNSI